LDGSLDFFAIGLSMAALLGIFRFKLGLIPIIVLSGLIGMAYQLLF